jgi:hypothetical protein
MKISDIINQLRVNKVTPKLEKDQLKLLGETSNLSKDFIEIIKKHKIELIDFLKESTKQFTYESIHKIPKQEYYPLSSAQKGVWILSRFKGGTSAYNIVSSFYLKGTVIKSNLNNAFKEAINKHESLRTIFKTVGRIPYQFILDKIDFEIEENDFSKVSEINKGLEAEIELATNSSFQLENGPLIKVKLIKISDLEYALIIVIHHIISDGWSIAVLMQEVMSMYKSNCEGQIHNILPLPIQYKDYSNWLRQKLMGENEANHRKYWINRFAEPIEPLQIPSDYPRPEIKSFAGSSCRFYFEVDQYCRIRNFCKSTNTNLFIFLHSVLTILLYKYSGQRKIVLGVPVSGRNHFDLESQIGLYVNTIAFKTEINPDKLFLDYLKENSEQFLLDFEHQEYPFDQVVEALDLERDTSRNPLFDVMIVLQNAAFGDGSVDITKQYGFELSFLDNYLYRGLALTKKNVSSKFDLNFDFLIEPGNNFRLEIEYCLALFNRERIETIFEMFTYIISQVLENPDSSLAKINCLSEKKRHQLFHSGTNVESLFTSAINNEF